MNNENIAESINCEFGIIQNPDIEHLRIKLTPFTPDSHLDDFLLSLDLHPNIPVEQAQQLENLLNECVKTLWVSKMGS